MAAAKRSKKAATKKESAKKKRKQKSGNARSRSRSSSSVAVAKKKMVKGKGKTAASGRKSSAAESRAAPPDVGSTVTIFCRRDLNRYLRYTRDLEKYETALKGKKKASRSRRSLNSLSEEEQMKLILAQSLSVQ